MACDVYNGEETGETAATVTSATGIANASGPKVMAASADLFKSSKEKSTIQYTEEATPLLITPRPHCVCSWNGDTTPKASEDVSVTLRSQQGGEGVGVASNLTVRRLTPREVMRLQGFDDDHCAERCELELVGNEWKATGKVVKQADGPIYKQAGNAVSVPVAEWIGRRLKRLQAPYTPEELEELGVGTPCPQPLGE